MFDFHEETFPLQALPLSAPGEHFFLFPIPPQSHFRRMSDLDLQSTPYSIKVLVDDQAPRGPANLEHNLSRRRRRDDNSSDTKHID
jgi:hypothetical protein